MENFMTPNITNISIAVDDLNRAISFYSDGLGWPCWSHPSGTPLIEPDDEEALDHAAFEMQHGLSLVLYQRESLARDVDELNMEKGATDFVLNYNVQNEADVQLMLNKVLSIGAKQLGDLNKQSWGTTAKFRDLDGHLWEIMWSAA